MDDFKNGEIIERLEDYLSVQVSFEETSFVNISNHSLSDWSEKQKKAALGFASHIAELPFPSIPPEMSTEEIEKIAESLLKDLPENTTHAMVMGEFVLTHILVKKLQRQDIVCLAVTTERHATENAGVKNSVFDFVTFRPYPA